MTIHKPSPFALRLIQRRSEKGWSQNTLARQCDIAPAQISRYESGAIHPDVRTMGKLAAALDVDVFWLINGNHNEASTQGMSEGAPFGAFIERLVRKRTEKKWSQNMLAQRSGVAPAQLCRYENGKNYPNTHTLEKLAKALDVAVTWLTGKDEYEAGAAGQRETTPNKGTTQLDVTLTVDMDIAIKRMATENGLSASEVGVQLLKHGLEIYKNAPLLVLKP